MVIRHGLIRLPDAPARPGLDPSHVTWQGAALYHGDRLVEVIGRDVIPRHVADLLLLPGALGRG